MDRKAKRIWWDKKSLAFYHWDKRANDGIVSTFRCPSLFFFHSYTHVKIFFLRHLATNSRVKLEISSFLLVSNSLLLFLYLLRNSASHVQAYGSLSSYEIDDWCYSHFSLLDFFFTVFLVVINRITYHSLRILYT